MRNFGQVPGLAVRPGTKEGEFLLPTGETIRLVDWREDFIYDRVALPTSISAGAEYVFFRDIQNKNLVDTNLTTSSKLPSGWEAIVWKIGFLVAVNAAYADAQAVLANGYVEFKTGASNVVRQGPAWMHPAGFGPAGFSALDAQTAATERTVITNGTPAPGAVTPLSIPIHIKPDLTFQGLLKFYSAVTLSATTNVYMVLTCWVKRPVA